MSFGQPWLLGLLVFIPLAFGLWVVGVARGRSAARRMSRVGPRRAPWGAAVLVSLAAAAAIVAAAQPRWGTRETFIPKQGAQVIVVLDVSRSMAARDVAPNRLGAAKIAVNQMISRLGGDRVGLVIFGGDARLRFPLTSDLDAARQVIGTVEPGPVFVDGGTNAGSGLDIAIDSFDGTEGGRLILLITDGEDVGTDPAAVAQRIREAGVELLIAGAGTVEGATIPVFDSLGRNETPKKDASGADAISKLNDGFLRALAVAAGGRYVGSNLAAVPGAVEGRLTALTKSRFDRQAAEFPIERYQWFAGAALVLLLLGLVAEQLALHRRTAVAALAAFALLLGACSTRAHDLNEEGREALATGDVPGAIALFREAQTEQPDDPQISLNLAAALHAAKRYEEAGQAARRALTASDSETRARAFASIGHHRFALEDLNGSLDAFRQALLENPRDDASRHDFEVVLRLLFPPDRGEEPGENEPGDGDPEPGSSPTPGEGTPEPGDNPNLGGGEPGEGIPGASPTPGGQPGDGPGGGGPGGNDPGGGRPLTPAEAERAIAALDRQIATILREADDLTAEEAVNVLELLAERARLSALRQSGNGSDDPNDR